MGLRDRINEHKGKTVTLGVGAIATAIITIATSGDIPLPVTKAYVDQQDRVIEAHITQATQGLPYLVRTNITRDTDAQWYLVYCMNHFDQRGALERLVSEYKALTGEEYKEKTCEQLELMLQAKGR